MFNEVSIATDRLALCLHTQRRIGAAHALVHLRRLVVACQQECGFDATDTSEARRLLAAMAPPLQELDDALATDRLDTPAMVEAEHSLSFIRFQFWRIERLYRTARSADPSLRSG